MVGPLALGQSASPLIRYCSSVIGALLILITYRKKRENESYVLQLKLPFHIFTDVFI